MNEARDSPILGEMQRFARSRSLAWALPVVITCAPVVALAQTTPSRATEAPSGPEEARRTTLYELGVAAAAANRWEEARERFQATLAIRSSPKVLFSLAEAEEHLGHVASAQASYERAVEGARQVQGEADVVRAALAAIHGLEPRVPHLRVTVSGAESATVMLDGHPVAVGARVALDPGTHQLEAHAAGYRAVSMSVAVGVGGELDVPLHLDPDGVVVATTVAHAPAPTIPATAPTATTGGPSARTIIGLAGAAAGVVALGIGTYFALEAKAKNDDSYSAGCRGDLCPSAGFALRQDSLSAARAATGTVIAGGALVAAGLTVWWVAPSSSRAANSTTVGLRPAALGTSGGSLALVGTWR